MAAPSNTSGQPKYGQRNYLEGLKIVLPAPAATSQQVHPRISTFDGLIIAPPAAASTSAESKPSSGMEHLPYDVFINHRGEDVKYTVASNIYNKLTATGLRVFLDKDELKLGDFFPKTLEEAIRSASLHIAIFSENYANSPWCLAELACMLQTGIKFIPIFYHVQPSTLRWAIKGKGIYADAFSKDEMKNRYTLEQLQSWKLALHNATLHIGETIYNQGEEEKAVTNVVNRVLQELKKELLHVAKHPVGLDEAEQDFHEKIALQFSGPVQIVGIYGMGGMGKTTLAKRLFNQNCSTIGKSSFVSDVREAAKNNRLHKKQKELLEDLDVKSKDFKNVDKGKEILKSRLRSVSVLIVLDDVDHTDQLDALLPARDSLGQGSLIIVTTRELSVLRAGGISTKYQMRKLNDAHAEKLFCWHAFGQPSPLLEFKELAGKFIKACHGLPLSLKVLGSLLCGESSKKYWQSQLDKLSRLLPDDIKLRLKISYDSLDKEEKEMLLDVACFFVGWTSSTAIAVWDGSEWNGLHGWQRLVNKCLVELDENNLIRMHDHLRDLGREIANQQSPYRLWCGGQIIEIQPQQEAIQIRGMKNAVGDNCCPRQGKIIIRTSQGERILTPDSLGLKIFVGNGDFINEERSELSRELVCFECDGFEHKNLPAWFSLKKLKNLELDRPKRLEDLWERDADAPLQLRELVIYRFSSSFRGFPSSIAHLKNLKKISIWEDKDVETLSGLPEEFCNLHSLEHLEINWCSNLSYLPTNFGKLTTLQHLDLHGCSTLKMLPDSCKKLTLLEYLDLSFCYELTIKPESHILQNMTKLGYLNLDWCEKLEELHLPEMASLTKLFMKGTSLKDMTVNIFQQTKLTELAIGSKFLTTLPTCLGNLSSLTTLKIEGCQKLESLPDSLEHLSFLTDLQIERSGVKCLPKSSIHLQSLKICQTPISDLSYGPGCMLKTIVLEDTKVSKISICGDCCPFLETLKLSSNEDLREIEILPATLKSLYVDKCKVLKDIRGVSGLKKLKNLSIRDCEEVVGFSCFAELVSLETFELIGSSKVKQIAGLQELRSLQELSIELDELPDLAELTSLRKITLQKCKKWKKIERLDHLRSLEELKISDCPELEALPSLLKVTSLKNILLKECPKLKIECLKRLASMEKLVIDNCPELDGLPGLAELISLKEFQLEKCDKLKKVEGLESLRSLESLKIIDCPELDGLPSLVELTSLKKFELGKCNKLEKIEGLESLLSLENMKIIDNPELDGLPSLAVTSLKKFELVKCNKWKKIEGLESLKSLETLIIDDCSELDTLPTLEKLTILKEIELKNCSKLEKIESFKSLGSLEILKIQNCPVLDGLPSLAELISLKTFKLEWCHKLEKIEGFESLRSLEALTVNACPKLDNLPSLAQLTSLKKFELIMCYKLEKIEGLESLRSLKKLRIDYCTELNILPSLVQSTFLKEIELENCNKLEKIESFKSLRSLKMLRIYKCSELDGLPSLTELISLKKFELIKCHKLKKIECLESLKSLEKLSIEDCSTLDTLPNLAESTPLKIFELIKCHKLNKMGSLESLRSLEMLHIKDCPTLNTLPNLKGLTSLKQFKLKKCNKLKKIQGLECLRSLETLTIGDCPELGTLPSLAELTSLEEFKLKYCHKLEKITGLERLSSLEKLEVQSLAKGPCIVNLDKCERLKLLVLVANDRRVGEPFISNIQKWPREVIMCSRAMIDVGSLKNFFAPFRLKNVVEFGLFGGLSLRRPQSSANANAILICCIIDSVYPELLFEISTDKYYYLNAKLANGIWLWMGIFPQGSDWLQSNQYEIRASMEDKDVKLTEAWFVMGEAGGIVEAFRHLSQS